MLAPLAKGEPVTKHQERNQEHAEYLAWVHTRPCAACGTRKNIQAAHVGRGGMGMKHGSDAEVIPLCGPHWDDVGSSAMLADFTYYPKVLQGCHSEHDQRSGRFAQQDLRDWDAHQIAVHRGLFAIRNVGAQVVPF